MSRKDANERGVVHMNTSCSREEYAVIRSLWGESTCRSLSEYVRKVLLKKPVAVKCRIVSLDELIAELNELRNQFERVMSCNPRPMELELLNNILRTVTQIANKITGQCIQK